MRRNVDRFPSDFCFQLSDKETNDLRCQKGTTNFLSSKRRYNSYAYTEEGIITLRATIEFIGLCEQINNTDFNMVEFDQFKNKSGHNYFVMTPTKWAIRTNAIGFKTKSGNFK